MFMNQTIYLIEKNSEIHKYFINLTQHFFYIYHLGIFLT